MTTTLSKVSQVLPNRKWVCKKTVVLGLAVKLFQITGLFPCTLDMSASICLLPSHLWVLHNIMLIAIFSYCNYCVGLPALIEKTTESNGFYLGKTLEGLQIGLSTTTSMVIWIIYPLTCTRLMIFGKKVIKADAIAKNLGDDYQLETSGKKSMIIFTIYLIFFSLLIFTDYMAYDDPMSPVVWLCVYCLPAVIIILFLIQYSLAVQLTSRRMKALNNTISRSLETTAHPTQRNLVDNAIIKTFDVWKKAHDELYEANAVIAKFYSFPVLFVIGYICYAVIFNSYHAVKDLRARSSQTLVFGVINDCVWLFAVTMPTVILMYEIEDLLTQAREKAVVCRKLALLFQKNQLFWTQIKMYSHELLHENINFTAFGFFSLDGTVLHSISATTVTYLVIIHQFHNVYEE